MTMAFARPLAPSSSSAHSVPEETLRGLWIDGLCIHHHKTGDHEEIHTIRTPALENRKQGTLLAIGRRGTDYVK